MEFGELTEVHAELFDPVVDARPLLSHPEHPAGVVLHGVVAAAFGNVGIAAKLRMQTRRRHLLGDAALGREDERASAPESVLLDALILRPDRGRTAASLQGQPADLERRGPEALARIRPA